MPASQVINEADALAAGLEPSGLRWDGPTGLQQPASAREGYLARYTRRWVENDRSWAPRGMPAPLGPADRRPFAEMKFLPPFGYVLRRQTRPYDRGTDSLSWQGGVLTYDPIGAGVVFTQKLNILSRAVGTYVNGAIFWNTTPVNFARLPTTGPLLTPGQAAALLGDSADAATIVYNPAPINPEGPGA